MQCIRYTWLFGLYKQTRKPLYIVMPRNAQYCTRRSPELSKEQIEHYNLLKCTKKQFNATCKKLVVRRSDDDEDQEIVINPPPRGN